MSPIPLFLRSDQRKDFGKWVDERWAWDTCGDEFFSRICDGGGVESCGCDKNKGDEHEGRDGTEDSVRRDVGLCDEDRRTHEFIQRIYTHNLKAWTIYGCAICTKGLY
ncbi:hypothetical protein V6N13_088018 [Hibiscus sabdariffa]|uniref:Uncharacterized protein n=1 Tax=Hibiscus sabdariffa TaxID=183260 RepID=A0ABR2FYG4_9ROSI